MIMDKSYKELVEQHKDQLEGSDFKATSSGGVVRRNYSKREKGKGMSFKAFSYGKKTELSKEERDKDDFCHKVVYSQIEHNAPKLREKGISSLRNA
jgi:hypothetical protein